MPAPIAPHLSAFAPDFARRFALITAALAATIARVFLRNPRLVLLIIPLYTRLTRASQRCTRLMALLAAGKLPRHHRPGKSGPHAPKPGIPRAEAWLIHTLHHEAANYASQLAHLLAEPAAAELLTTTPAASHLLRPICRLLGISGHVAQRSGIDSDRGAPSPATATPSRCESWAPRKRSLPPSAETAPPPDAPLLPAPPPPAPPLPALAPPILRPPPCPNAGFPWLPGWKPA